NFRLVRLNAEMKDPQDLFFLDEPFNDQYAGLFAIDRMDLTEDLAFEGQVRGDWYSETQLDWSALLAALYGLDEDHEHILRLSSAKAFRAPLTVIREPNFLRIPLGPPGLYAMNVLPASGLDNEETWSIEGGYSGRIGEGLTLQSNAYYQRFERMIGFRRLPDPMSPVLNRIIYQADNIDGADSAGIEVEIEKKGDPGKVALWYSYNTLQTDEHNQNMRAYAPSKHKAGLRGSLRLDQDWSLNGQYRYNDVTGVLVSDSLTKVGVYNRMDLNIAKRFESIGGELMVGVNDLFNRTNGPASSVGQTAAHTTPGRTFFVRLQITF
ncbi:MAG: TonB-dependent receptor, partial [Planctomycetes bacterium]|nr:TonB-dependent receptor [Planctomycetota bacterium]